MEAEISLTDEKKRNISIDITNSSSSRPFISTLLLYKRDDNLYFISVNTPFESEKRISQDELIKTVYLLVKNWDVYERR